jgi:hypothetical protein
MSLDTVTQYYDVFYHGWFVRMIQPDMPMIFIDPSLNGKPDLSN